MDLADSLNNIVDRDSFIIFVRELIKDREIARKIEIENSETNKHTNVSEWQNQTIEDFLEGAISWLEDSERKNISWKLMAEFLHCGKIYE